MGDGNVGATQPRHEQRQQQLQHQEETGLEVSPTAVAPAAALEWSHINWATTYSSDEESHTSASSQFLGVDLPQPQGLDRHEDLLDSGDDESEDNVEDDLGVASHHGESDGEGEAFTEVDRARSGSPPFLDETIRTTRTPPRTRRRTRSRSLHYAPDTPFPQHPHDGGTAASPPVDTILIPHQYGVPHTIVYSDATTTPLAPSYWRPPPPAAVWRTRSILTVLGLVCTFLVLGVHPDHNHASPLPLTHPVSSGPDAPLGVGEPINVSPILSDGSAAKVHHDFRSSDPEAVLGRPRMMHALRSSDGVPLTYRRSVPASSFVVGHVAYVAFLVAVLGWSVREVRREVQARRDHEEPVCGCCDVV